MLLCVCVCVFNYISGMHTGVVVHASSYTQREYYCAVCPQDSQKGTEENGEKGCASRQRLSPGGVLINESHLFNLRLLLCCCTFTVLQSISQPCANLPDWHNMAQGVDAVTANRD